MDENEEFEFRLRMEQEAAAQAPTPPLVAKGHGPLAPQPAKWSEFNPVEALGEGAAQLASGAVAGTLGAAGYGATAAGKALGITDAEPAKVMSDIAEPLTYKPTSKSSQLVERAAKTALKPAATKTAELGDEAATAVGKVSPVAETMMREAPAAATAALGVLPLAAGAKPAIEAATAARAPVQGAVKAGGDDIVETLRAGGYKVRPSDVKALKPGEKVPGQFRESLQEPAKLRKDLTLENQANTTRLAAEDLGLKDKKSLMEKDYEQLRKPHFDKYDDVNSAIFKVKPNEDFVTQLQTARDRAGFKATDDPKATQIIAQLRKNERKGRLSDDKVKQADALKDGEAADALEAAIGKRLESLGEDKLLGEYQSSRQALAKIRDYENATKGGQVDATRMAALAKKSPGRLTGNAKLIADAGEHIPNVARSSRGATGVRSSVKAEGGITSRAINAGRSAIGKIPGLDVTRSGFQNKFGREAVGAERDFSDYGKRMKQPETRPGVPPQLGAGDVQFTPTSGVPPAASLASELNLMPEPVANPQQFPPSPDFLTADVPPPVRYEGGLDFQASPPLAEDFGFTSRPGDGVPFDLEWQPVADVSAAPDLSMLNDLVEQLGLSVDTPQPSLMTPVTEPVPFGPRVQLESPPGRVGKPKVKK